jgi:hypothetical protein
MWNLSIVLARSLRETVRHREITCSVGIWDSPNVEVDARYAEGGKIDPIQLIGYQDNP